MCCAQEKANVYCLCFVWQSFFFSASFELVCGKVRFEYYRIIRKTGGICWMKRTSRIGIARSKGFDLCVSPPSGRGGLKVRWCAWSCGKCQKCEKCSVVNSYHLVKGDTRFGLKRIHGRWKRIRSYIHTYTVAEEGKEPTTVRFRFTVVVFMCAQLTVQCVVLYITQPPWFNDLKWNNRHTHQPLFWDDLGDLLWFVVIFFLSLEKHSRASLCSKVTF